MLVKYRFRVQVSLLVWCSISHKPLVPGSNTVLVGHVDKLGVLSVNTEAINSNNDDSFIHITPFIATAELPAGLRSMQLSQTFH